MSNAERIVMKKKLIIFGIEDFAQIAYEYFTHDSEYEVVAFTVHKEYIKQSTLLGVPVVPFGDIENLFLSKDHDIFVAVTYGNMNRNRALICGGVKSMGYKLANYISSNSFVWPGVKFGEHCFVFEANVIQPFVVIGDNCVLWSGNHIGHHSILGDNLFISSHVVVSGWCDIGDNCFLGVNSTLSNNTKLGKESWVMPNAFLKGNIPSNSFVKTASSEIDILNEKALSFALKKATNDRNK